MFDSDVNYDKNRDIGFRYRSGIAYFDIRSLYSSWGMVEKEVTITSFLKDPEEAVLELYSHISAVHV